MHTRVQFARAAMAVFMSTCLISAAASAQQSGGTTPAARPNPAGDWSAVDSILGRKGAVLPGNMVKYGFPRTDLTVTTHGVQLKPAFALGGWIAFRTIGSGRTMAMGDLVLTETEVGPVMRALQQGGVDQTALHNHLMFESPRIMYLHVAATGDPVKIARTVRAALATTGTPLVMRPAPTSSPAPAIDLDTAGITRALGVGGQVNGGVLQVGVPRRETIREGHDDIPPAMGVATGINFQPTGGGKAAITGDFVMRASEVNAVIRALQESGIEIEAIHSHMLDEEPRLFFLHFWATGDAVPLARGLRRALDQVAAKSSRSTKASSPRVRHGVPNA